MGSVTSDTHQFDLQPLGELRIVVARYNEELTPWKPVAKCVYLYDKGHSL
jgi:hypothetical protein